MLKYFKHYHSERLWVSLWTCLIMGWDISRILDKRGLNSRSSGELWVTRSKFDPFFLGSKHYWGTPCAEKMYKESSHHRDVSFPHLYRPHPSQSLQVSPLSLYNVLLPFNAFSDLAIVPVSFLLLTFGCPLRWFPKIHFYCMNEMGLLFTFSLGPFKGTTGHSVWLSLNQPQRVSGWSYSRRSTVSHGPQS